MGHLSLASLSCRGAFLVGAAGSDSSGMSIIGKNVTQEVLFLMACPLSEGDSLEFELWRRNTRSRRDRPALVWRRTRVARVTPIFYCVSEVSMAKPRVKLILGYWWRQLDLRVSLQVWLWKSTSDIPFGCNGSYMVWFIWKTQLHWNEGCRPAAQNIPRGWNSKPMLSKAFLTGYMERTCSQIFLAMAHDASNNLFLPNCQ
jgi:hypothetical protein